MKDGSGVFSSVVLLAKDVLAEETLNKVRGGLISKLSDLISGFVFTAADSEIGKSILIRLFEATDKKKDGLVDADKELTEGLHSIRICLAPGEANESYSVACRHGRKGRYEKGEWLVAAPKTLRTNLMKLAKKNGGHPGFLA